MVRVYKTIKKKYPDAFILVRVDDNYYTYEEDAVIMKKVFGYDNCFSIDKIDYVFDKLLSYGLKIALCETTISQI